jgi:glutamine synthetase
MTAAIKTNSSPKTAKRSEKAKKSAAKPVEKEARPISSELAVATDSAAMPGKHPEPSKSRSPKTKKSAEKSAKEKLVRDSFTMPETEYALFKSLKGRCLAQGIEVKKSELLRAAMKTLAGMKDAKLVETIQQLERLKTGRPAG